MKKIMIILAIFLLAACSADIGNEEIKVVTFDTSITCADCVTKMFDSLPKEKGVIDLDVGLDEKRVTIVFNSIETNIDNLAEKINELGYSALVKNLSIK